MHQNAVEFSVFGDYALFSDPVTRTNGQKCSYSVPTYEALKGIMKAIYWKPTIIWYVDAVRIVNPIRMYSRGVRPIHYQDNKNDLAYYTYLEEVVYHVRCHFEWNMLRPELACDRSVEKHMHMAEKAIRCGGRRPVFLGTSECVGYVEPFRFNDGISCYAGEMNMGLMLHGITYPDEAYSDDTKNMLTVGMWAPVMKDGIIEFIRPEDCPVKKPVREAHMRIFGSKQHNIEITSDSSGKEVV